MPENSLPVSSSEATEFVRSFDQIKIAARRFGNEIENLTDAVAQSQAVQIAANTTPGRRGPQPQPESSFQQASARLVISDQERKELAEKVSEEIRLRVENFFRAAPITGEAIGVFDAIFGDIPQLQTPGEPAGFKLLGGAFEKLKERSRGANLRQQAAIANKLEDLITDLVLRQQSDVEPLAKVLDETIEKNRRSLELANTDLENLSKIKNPTQSVQERIKENDRLISILKGENEAAEQAVENRKAQFDELIAKAQSLLNRLNREATGKTNVGPGRAGVITGSAGDDALRGFAAADALETQTALETQVALLDQAGEAQGRLNDQVTAAGPAWGEVIDALAEKGGFAGLLPTPELLADAGAGLSAFAGTAAERFSETAQRLQDGLGQTILDIFDGASPKAALKNFTRFAKASFSGLLQDLAGAALRNPIVINFAQQLTGGLSGGLASLGGGLLRGAGSFFGLGGGGSGAGVGGFGGGQFDIGTLASLGSKASSLFPGGSFTTFANNIGNSIGLEPLSQSGQLALSGPQGGYGAISPGNAPLNSLGATAANAGYGVVGGFAGQLASNALGLGSDSALVNTGLSTAGSTVGAYIGTVIFPGVGTAIGAFLGNIAGNALASIVGPKAKKPTAQLLTRGTTPSAEELAGGVFFDSEFIETPFGTTGFTGGATRKVTNDLVTNYLTFIEGFDDAIAGFLDEDQVTAGRAALVAKGEGLKEKFKDFDGEAFTIAADRLETILQGALGEAAASAIVGKVEKPESGDPKVVEASINQLLGEAKAAIDFVNSFDENLRRLSEGTIDFADKALEQARQSVDQTIASMDAFRQRAEELGLDTEAADAALGQLVRSMIGLEETTSEALGPLDAARQAIDAQFDAWEERLDDLAKFGITQTDLDEGRALAQARANEDFFASISRELEEMLDPIGVATRELEKQRDLTLEQAKSADATPAQLAEINQLFDLRIERQAEATGQAVAAAMIEALQPVIAEIQNDIASREALQRSFESAAENIAQFRQSLLTSDLSPLSPKAKLDAAESEFNRLAQLAQAGDINAINGLPGAAQAFLQASRDYNGISGFAPDFDRVQDVLASTETIAEREIRIQEEQLDVLRQQLALLRGDDQTGIPPDINGVSALRRAITGRRDQIIDLALQTNQDTDELPLFGLGSQIGVRALGDDSLLGTISRGRRNAIARALGFQGDFGGQGFINFRNANPDFNLSFEAAVAERAGLVSDGITQGVPGFNLELTAEQRSFLDDQDLNRRNAMREELVPELQKINNSILSLVGPVTGPGGIVNSILDIDQEDLTAAVTGSRAEVEALGFGGSVNDATQFGINALRRNAIARALGYTGSFGGDAFNDFFSSGVDPAFNQAFIQQVNARLSQASREQLSLQVPGIDTPTLEGATNPYLPQSPTTTTPIATHPTEPETSPVTEPPPDPPTNDNDPVYTPSRREIAIFGDYAQTLALGHGGARDKITSFGISQFRRNAIAKELGFTGVFDGSGSFFNFYNSDTAFKGEFDRALERRARAKAAGELGQFPPRFQFGGLAERGLAIVGEAGPELVRFNAPGFVHTAQETRRFFDFTRIAGALREIANDEREQRLARVQQAEIHHQEQRDEIASLRREIRELRDMMARRAELRQRVAA